MLLFEDLEQAFKDNNFNRTSILLKSRNTKCLYKKNIHSSRLLFFKPAVYYTSNSFFHTLTYEENFKPSPKELTKFFKENKIDFEEGFTCYKIKCPLCQEKKKTQSNQLYINKPTGIFLCDTCNLHGQWQILNNFLKTKFSQGKLLSTDIKTLKEKYISNNTKAIEKWDKIIKQSQLLTTLTQDRINEILKQFNLPEVSKSNLEQFNIYYDEKQNQLYVPLKTISGDIGGFKTITTANEEETFPRKNCFGLIYVKQGRSKDEAIVVSKLSDALALSVSKINGHIICLPYGTTTLPIEVLPILEKFKKITLWFPNDIQSWETSKVFSKKLNVKRCYFLRPFVFHPAPYDALQSDINLKEIYKTAQPVWHKSIITFENLREDVFLELQNNEKIQGIKWNRFPTLTKLLKGHRRGELTVITGPTGSGKTTFISEYSLDLAQQGVNTLWGSFEIRNERLAKTLLKQLSLINLENHLDQFDYWADEFAKLPIYFLTFHGQQSIKVVMDTLEHATYVHDINHVIIDNLQFMMGISLNEKSDRFWKQDVIISGFRSFATKKNCHVTLVIHPRKERNEDDLTINSIFGTGKAVQESDNVLLIQDKRLLSVKGKKYLQVAKNRYSGDLGIMPLSFDKDSLSFAIRKKTPNKEESCSKEESEPTILK